MYNRQQLIDYAKECYPREACGLIVDGCLIPITNISSDPDNGFVMCPYELAQALDECEPSAIFHSHPDDTAKPSPHDIARINRADTPLPWVIVSVPDIDVSVTFPSGVPALLGRTFTHGVNDCYTLLRDFYMQKLGIAMANYVRDDEWWQKGQDLYLENYMSEGFVDIPASELQYGDIVLIQVMSDTTNHAGVYLGNGTFMHHLYDRLSRIDTYGGYWLERTTRTIRHKLYNASNVKPITEADHAHNN